MAELFLRDIKTTLRADVLRCKSPWMIVREVWMILIAYNLIRALMGRAARRHHADPLRISFKGALATVRQWLLAKQAWAPVMAYAPLAPTHRAQLMDALLLYVAKDIVPWRHRRLNAVDQWRALALSIEP